MLRYARLAQVILMLSLAVISSSASCFVIVGPGYQPFAEFPGDPPLHNTLTEFGTDIAALAVLSFMMFCATVFVEYMVISRVLECPKKSKGRLAFWVLLVNLITKPSFLLGLYLGEIGRTVPLGATAAIAIAGAFGVIALETLLLSKALLRLYHRSGLLEPVSFGRSIKITIGANLAAAFPVFLGYFFLSETISIWRQAVITG
jgi:hypothetical protein